MSRVMIELRDVAMRLSAGRHIVTVLDGITLEVPAGQCVAVVGPSGSGKSTLLGLIAGLDRPTAGAITVDGIALATLDEDALARLRRDRIGYVFQAFHLIPTLTALENVAVPLELAGAPDPLGQARRLLGEVDLADRLHHYPVQLSGGEQQRVALARAFANRPVLLLADEPTGNLDSATGAAIIELLVARHRADASTLVLVTHDPALAGHADRVVELRDGRIVGDRPSRAAA
jgi:putative ABC transport system ATP-binding protein